MRPAARDVAPVRAARPCAAAAPARPVGDAARCEGDTAPMHRCRPSAYAVLCLPALAQAPAALPAPLQPVPFHAVHVDDPFWSERLATNARVAIAHAFAQCRATGRIANFRVAGGLEPGGKRGYCFDDSDVYKLIEGAAHVLRTHRDPELERQVDEVVDAIVAAQQPDGYLYTARTIGDPANPPPGGAERWSDVAHGHELYNAGHLYEAAVAYVQATGKTKLYDVALANASLVMATFGPGRDERPPGHPEIELGLLALWRHTGAPRYRDQAKWFVDARGRGDRPRFGDYAQDTVPVVDQQAIVGHAVRAAYLYAAATDLAHAAAEPRLLAASARLFDDMLRSQIYLTGGIGSQGSNEGFGVPFQLPNHSGYGETCASIGNALWAQRLFLATGHARYLDVVEAVLWNAFPSGWSRSGDAFFYPNPLASRGAVRQPWFPCACCPPNVTRFVPQVPGLVFATGAGTLYVNQFVGCRADVTVDGARVGVALASGCERTGVVRVAFDLAEPRAFALRVRLPDWARGAPLPGGLYHHVAGGGGTRTLTVNGEPAFGHADAGFVVVDRTWRDGDVCEYTLPLPVQRVACDERVASNRGRVALMRGPLVYCFEGIDNAGDGGDPGAPASVQSLVLADDAKLGAAQRADLFGGIPVVTATVRRARRTLAGDVVLGEPFEATAIPYAYWANRGRTSMAVWIARTADAAWPEPAPTIARRARATASFAADLSPLSDQRVPAAPGDREPGHVVTPAGGAHWVVYELDAPVAVGGVEITWFADGARCRAPRSWRVEARAGNGWRTVDAPDGWPTALDRACRATFAPVTTTALRLVVDADGEAACGMHEWAVLPAAGGAR